MATISTLTVDLTMNTAKFARGAAQGIKQVTKLGTAVKSVGTGVGRGLQDVGKMLSRIGPAGFAAGAGIDGLGKAIEGLISLSPSQVFSGIVTGSRKPGAVGTAGAIQLGNPGPSHVLEF